MCLKFTVVMNFRNWPRRWVLCAFIVVSLFPVLGGVGDFLPLHCYEVTFVFFCWFSSTLTALPRLHCSSFFTYTIHTSGILNLNQFKYSFFWVVCETFLLLVVSFDHCTCYFCRVDLNKLTCSFLLMLEIRVQDHTSVHTDNVWRLWFDKRTQFLFNNHTM